jgi:predicted NAD/FAD-dependent oxidoreductase
MTAQRAGADVQVLDKGRGMGGRLATRRLAGEGEHEGVCDYGAQYFTVRNPAFQPWVRDWEKAGAVRIWSRGFAEGHGGMKLTLEPRYRGEGGMRSIARHVGRDLAVSTNTRVVSLAWSAGSWCASDEKGQTYAADVVVLTPPVPQSLALLHESRIPLPDDMVNGLLRVSYWPCIALLVMLEGESAVPEPGGVWLNGQPIAWIADNRRKGISPGAVAVSIHAGHAFSRGHWDEPDDIVMDSLLAAAAPWLGSRVSSCQVHRWRYSRPEETYDAPFAALRAPGPLAIAGDGFGGGRLEGAFLSGVAAGTSIARMMT